MLGMTPFTNIAGFKNVKGGRMFKKVLKMPFDIKIDMIFA